MLMFGLGLGLAMAAGGAPSTPVFTANPVMTMSGGTLDVGSTVTSTSGTVVGADLITYEWQADGVALYDGYGLLATNTTHVVQKGAQWKVLRCKVTATNAHGSTVAYSNDLGRVTVDFGEKTKSGWGGFPLGLGAVTITGGANADDFAISSGKLIPSGTKNATKTFSASTYALTLSNGETLRIRIVPKSITIAVETSDTRDDNQLQRALNQTGANAPKLGWDVWMRDGFHNPTSADYYIDIPTGGYAADTGMHVKVRSETVDLTLDVEGNPNHRHGAKLGAIRTWFDTAGTNAKLLFLNTWHTCEISPVPRSHLHTFGGSAASFGYGVSFDAGRCDVLAGITGADSVTALSVWGGCSVSRMVFTNVLHGIFPTGSKTNGDVTLDWNIFFDIFSDGAQANGSNVYYRYNLAFRKAYLAGAHGDFFQHTGAQADTIDNGVVFSYNICVRGNGYDSAPDWQFQLMKGDLPVSTGRVTFTSSNNIYIGTASQGAWWAWGRDVVVACNTLLQDRYSNGPTPLNVTIRAISDYAGENLTLTRNVSNGLDVLATTGTITQMPSPNQTLTPVQQATAFPSLPTTAMQSGSLNRAAILQWSRPADLAVAAGGCRNPDGTFNGALFPNGAWNDGSVYDPANPTWVAAHPVAA